LSCQTAAEYWNQDLEVEINDIVIDGRYEQEIMELNCRNPKFNSPSRGLQRMMKGKLHEVILAKCMEKAGKNGHEERKWMNAWKINPNNLVIEVAHSEGEIWGAKAQHTMNEISNLLRNNKENKKALAKAVEATSRIAQNKRTAFLAANILEMTGIRKTKWTKEDWNTVAMITQEKEFFNQTANGMDRKK
jgi:hypothetical protein